MAKKVYDEPISASTDWGGDESTGGAPVSGKRVQEYIKEEISTIPRVQYYDASRNEVLLFNTVADQELYVSNPEKYANLVLVHIEAPLIYSAEIKLISERYNAVKVGSTGNVLSFTFDTFNKDMQSTKESVRITYTFRNGNYRESISQKYRADEEVNFNVDEYLREGTNNIQIFLQSEDNHAETSVAVTYQMVNLTLSTDYNVSTVIDNTNKDGVAEIPFFVSGTGVKTMSWYVDGEKQEFDKDVDEILNSSVTRSKYLSVADLEEGVHRVQIVASVNVNGETFYSKSLFRDIIIRNADSESDDISVALSFEMSNSEGVAIQNDETEISVVQYQESLLTFAVYDPSKPAEVLVDINAVKGTTKTKVATLSTRNGIVMNYPLSLTITAYDRLEIKPQGNEVGVTVRLNIAPLDLNISEITSGLQLALDAQGKSNDQADRDVWQYGEYKTTFGSDTKWNSASGWSDGAFRLFKSTMSVDLSPLYPNPSTKGKTMEFEFTTDNVTDDDEALLDMRDTNGAGLLITASEVKLVSDAGNTLSTRFKSGDYIRVSIVINKATGTTEKKLAYIYINGIRSGAYSYADGERFSSTKNLSFSAQSCALLIRSIRIYDVGLTSDNILNNYILYRPSSTEMLATYRKNDIYYDAGMTSFSIDKCANLLPVMVVTGDIPKLEATTNKKEQIIVDVEYTNLQDPTRSFKLEKAVMTPQGTSSMSYPKKNFRLYTQKSDDTILYDADGRVVKDRLYSFKQGSIPVGTWCMKADYAESSSTHNTGIARLWNDAMKNARWEDEDLVAKYGQFPLRTKAQQSAIDNGYPYDVRTAIDGFPILMFYRKDENSELVFIGKYNFNNDKSTENVFGFRDIPGFDASKVQCFEFLNNGHHLALFEDVTDFNIKWEEAWESRYPDTKSPNLTALLRLATWLSSCKGNPTKFSEEVETYFDLPKLVAYYIYLMRFGAVDQTVKNSMLATEDGEHWYFINYDNDTVLGLRNDGLLVYDPYITRQTRDNTYTSEVYAYAGHSSTLWNCFEASEKCMKLVPKVDEILYAAGCNVETATDMFNVKQSGRWCERIYNQDSQYKYIAPYIDNGVNNLFMLQGSRASHRAWWLYRRFALYDSMYVTGDYKKNNFEIKVAGAPIGITFDITAGSSGYYGYGVNNDVKSSKNQLERGGKKTFTTDQILNVGDPLRIYMAPNISEIDVHNFAPYLSTVYMDKVYTEALGSQLKSLTLGGTAVTNESLKNISGLQSAVYLENLNIEGFKAITSLDLSEMKYLKTLNAKRSGLKNLLLADGAPVEQLELPSGMQSINLQGLDIPSDGLTFEDGGKTLNTITITNCPNLKKNSTFIKWWLANKTSADAACSVDIEVEWTDVTVDQLISLAKIRENGGEVRVRGKVKFNALTFEQMEKLMDAFGLNCFKKTNELYIEAPTGIFLVGPNSVKAGNTVTLTPVIIGEVSGEPMIICESSLPSYATLDATKGTLTVGRFFGSGSTYKFYVRANVDGKISSSESISVQIVGLTSIYSVAVSGSDVIRETSIFGLTFDPTNADEEYTTTWNVTGDAVTNGTVQKGEETNDSCEIIVNSIPEDDETFYISASVKTETGRNLTTSSFYVTVNSLVKPEPNGNIQLVIQTKNSLTEYIRIKTTKDCLILIPSLGIERTYNKGASEMYITGLSEKTNYYIEIADCSGVTNLGISYSNIIAFWSKGDSGLYKLFYNNANLRYADLSVFDNTGTDYDNALAYYRLSDEIPEKLIEKLKGATSAKYIFARMPLKEIPSGLFDGCNKITDLSNAFYQCTSLQSIPSGLFDDCTAVTSFYSTFNDCSSLQSIPNGLFDNCPAVTSFYSTFSYCHNITKAVYQTAPKCTAWTYYCSSSTTKTVVITDTQAPNTYVKTAFGSNASNITFYVPDDMVDTYKGATNWTDLTIKALSEYPGDENLEG